MRQYEYDISKYSSESFRQLVYFCSEDGKCNIDEVYPDQMKRLVEVLNERGAEGWELVQLSFSGGGIVAFWRREL